MSDREHGMSLRGGNDKVVKLDRTDSCINSLIIDNHWVI